MLNGEIISADSAQVRPHPHTAANYGTQVLYNRPLNYAKKIGILWVPNTTYRITWRRAQLYINSITRYLIFDKMDDVPLNLAELAKICLLNVK
jgi:hypothetical protein